MWSVWEFPIDVAFISTWVPTSLHPRDLIGPLQRQLIGLFSGNLGGFLLMFSRISLASDVGICDLYTLRCFSRPSVARYDFEHVWQTNFPHTRECDFSATLSWKWLVHWSHLKLFSSWRIKKCCFKSLKVLNGFLIGWQLFREHSGIGQKSSYHDINILQLISSNYMYNPCFWCILN